MAMCDLVVVTYGWVEHKCCLYPDFILFGQEGDLYQFSITWLFSASLHCIPFRVSYAQLGTCTVVSVNRTLVKDKMRRFKGKCAHFSFNKGPIYTQDGASAKFSTNSLETDNTLRVTVQYILVFLAIGRFKCVTFLFVYFTCTVHWVQNIQCVNLCRSCYFLL